MLKGHRVVVYGDILSKMLIYARKQVSNELPLLRAFLRVLNFQEAGFEFGVPRQSLAQLRREALDDLISLVLRRCRLKLPSPQRKHLTGAAARSLRSHSRG